MAGWVDRLAVVFPFEEPIFRAAGVNARFVGHPLLDELAPETDEATFRAELGIDPTRRVLGLLPGSRPQELAALLDSLANDRERLWIYGANGRRYVEQFDKSRVMQSFADDLRIVGSPEKT